MWARTGLWEPWEGNDPGPPGPYAVVADADSRFGVRHVCSALTEFGRAFRAQVLIAQALDGLRLHSSAARPTTHSTMGIVGGPFRGVNRM